MDKKQKLWDIALPLLLNMLVSQIQLVIDRSFLGQIQVEYMSALGNVSAPLWTTISVIFALSSGGTILISLAIGAKKMERAGEMAHAALKFNTIFSWFIFAFWLFLSRWVFRMMGVVEPILGFCQAYVRLLLPIILVTGVLAGCSSVLQSVGFTRPILISGIVRSGLNILLDWLLIFGKLGFPEMGLRGAALATTIAEFTGLFVLIFLMARTDRIPYKINFKKILLAPLAPFFKMAGKGLPAAGEELLWNAGNLGIIRLLNSISMIAAGVHTIIFSIDVIPALIFIAIGQGVMTLTGHHTGAGEKEDALKPGLQGLRDSLFIAVSVFLLFLLIPRSILGIFTSDQDIIDSSVKLLIIAGINFFPRSVNIIIGHAIRGFGDTQWMLKTQILGTIQVLALSAVFIFIFQWGILGVFIAVLIDETLRAFLNGFRFRKGPQTEALEKDPAVVVSTVDEIN